MVGCAVYLILAYLLFIDVLIKENIDRAPVSCQKKKTIGAKWYATYNAIYIGS